ncbi:MAG: VC0807 family protein [Acidimicrobiales bacterium]
MDNATVVHLPSPLASLRHALPALVEGVLAPFAVFYVILLVAGFRGALLAGLAWSYLALFHRLVRHQRPAGTVVIGCVVLTLRTAVSFATGSAFVYFAQPTLATGAVALAFLVSAALGRPLVERLARDFCPLDPEMVRRPAMRRFFLQISVLWASVLLVNTGLVLWLLLTSSVGAFVLERTATSWSLTALGILLSVTWFRRTMRRDGVRVRWGAAPATTGEPAR